MATRTSARFAKHIPRDVKRRAGRTPLEATPLAIRTFGVDVSADIREYVRKRMSRRLAKFAEKIERLTVRLTDVNGPRGGVDTLCRVKAVMSGLESVVYDTVSHDPREAIDRASHGIERAVRKTIAQRRALPRRRGVAVAKRVKSAERAMRPRAPRGLGGTIRSTAKATATRAQVQTR
ncbi:MAG TPA: HPF/RaiA family ribosome-associated protein [Labilithrix sp.]|nr:HPF/RaiA family ribosome-associated protein [Labilithrix sp.]